MSQPCALEISAAGLPGYTTQGVRRKLLRIYRRLFRHFGPRGWWPGETPFEVCVGAILVQNTSWTNAARAIANLKGRNLLSPLALRDLPDGRLARIIRPAGFFNVKVARLKEFVRLLWEEYGGDLERLFRLGTGELRRTLLGLKGVGPETADSILLYAADRPVFVVDAYTHRIFARLDMFDGPWGGRESYEALQGFFHRGLVRDVALYNEFHALLVELGKAYCRPRPVCAPCPLRPICPYPRLEAARGTEACGGQQRDRAVERS